MGQAITLPCPTTCNDNPPNPQSPIFNLNINTPIYYDGTSTLSQCLTICLSIGALFYDYSHLPFVGPSCNCFSSCPEVKDNFRLTTSTFLDFGTSGFIPACFPSTLPLTCSAGTNTTVRGAPATKFKCCIKNSNATNPIVNYPFSPTNYDPVLTDKGISNRGMLLGYLPPGCTSCFQYYNPADLGPASFYSAFPAYTTASLDTSSLAGLPLSCAQPTFRPYGARALAKFSCELFNNQARTVLSVVFACSGLNPITTTGFNKDCTLQGPIKPGHTKAFSFEVLPGDYSLTLISFTF